MKWLYANYVMVLKKFYVETFDFRIMRMENVGAFLPGLSLAKVN